jgi:signal transduction histidine kinase
MLERLVEDLLCVSQLELGVVETKVSEISLRMQLDSIVHDLQADTILIRTLSSSDFVVRADPDHVQRIMMNYLSNALKYGEPPVEVELGEVPSFAEVRVRDRGPGVPDEFVHRLFTKFARADSAMTGTRSGTGLGLSIVRGLAQANGGDAWYEPVVPHGACFGLRLPLSASA